MASMSAAITISSTSVVTRTPGCLPKTLANAAAFLSHTATTLHSWCVEKCRTMFGPQYPYPITPSLTIMCSTTPVTPVNKTLQSLLIGHRHDPGVEFLQFMLLAQPEMETPALFQTQFGAQHVLEILLDTLHDIGNGILPHDGEDAANDVAFPI